MVNISGLKVLNYSEAMQCFVIGVKNLKKKILLMWYPRQYTAEVHPEMSVSGCKSACVGPGHGGGGRDKWPDVKLARLRGAPQSVGSG